MKIYIVKDKRIKIGIFEIKKQTFRSKELAKQHIKTYPNCMRKWYEIMEFDLEKGKMVK